MCEDRKMSVVFLTISHLGKLPLDGAQAAVALYEMARTSDSPLDIYAATLGPSQDTVAWNLLRRTYAEGRILTANDIDGLVGGIEALFAKYDSVLVEFTGGQAILRRLIPLKKKYGSRLKIVASVYSYRHGTRLQWLCSLIYCYLYLRYVDQVVFGCPYAARNFTLSSLLFTRGKACIMPLLGTSANTGDTDLAWNVLSEKGLAGVLKDKDSFKLVYMAELRPVKNHVWLTEALVPIMKIEQNIHVIYCGGGNGAVASQVSAIAKKAGLENRFHLPGRIPYEAVPTVLKNCSCAIIPTCSETYGFTFIEPMMFGIPVLGTRVGVGEYVIQDYINGLSFSFDSPFDLRQKVRFLCKHREETARMGQNAKYFAQELYSMPDVVSARMSLYRDLLEL